MSRHRRFHLDHVGHSVTVNVRAGRRIEYELLVDGKEVGYRRDRRHGHAVQLLAGELPGSPARPFALRIEHPAGDRDAIACVLELDGAELPLAEATAG
ncbi:hypothetical protein AB0D08_15675 [Kitasatospora sp. NPDC048540]|uniref:hypothetical protein n=1 Tax=unclassified Kitasatospora TaxID=2633591 RepID=UPI000539AC28|nr:hypothetical protein [Kitasatospora sp. MBT63]